MTTSGGTTTFDWIVGNIARLVGVVWAVIVVLAAIGLILDPAEVRLGPGLAGALIGSAFVACVIAAFGLPGALIFLVVLRFLPLPDRGCVARRLTAIALAAAIGLVLYGSVARELGGATIVFTIPYALVVRFPPSWTSRRPAEPGAASP